MAAPVSLAVPFGPSGRGQLTPEGPESLSCRHRVACLLECLVQHCHLQHLPSFLRFSAVRPGCETIAPSPSVESGTTGQERGASQTMPRRENQHTKLDVTLHEVGSREGTGVP